MSPTLITVCIVVYALCVAFILLALITEHEMRMKRMQKAAYLVFAPFFVLRLIGRLLVDAKRELDAIMWPLGSTRYLKR